jgi:hypothetical protein
VSCELSSTLAFETYADFVTPHLQVRTRLRYILGDCDPGYLFDPGYKRDINMAHLDLSTTFHSWHVLAGHDRRRLDDELVHQYPAGARSDCDMLLQYRTDSHYGYCGDHYRYGAVSQPHFKRSRASRQVLGRCREAWGGLGHRW